MGQSSPEWRRYRNFQRSKAMLDPFLGCTSGQSYTPWVHVNPAEVARLDAAGLQVLLDEAAGVLARPPCPEEVETIRARLARYEAAHGFDGSELRRRLDAGEIRETLDVCHWLIDLNLFELLGQHP
jgi:hypothetical protein